LKKIIKISLLPILCTATLLSASEELSTVNQFTKMFTDGKVSGEVRTVYAGYDMKAKGTEDNYATALGGMLKYELARYKGFGAGMAVTTSYDLGFATGDKEKQNSELSSSDGDYTNLTEAYLDYIYNDLTLRVGRQVVDTPLADSDDARMIQNTFEAFMAYYELNEFSFTLGYLNRWQGVDTGLEDGWIDAKVDDTDGDGVALVGVTYSGLVDANAWYYNVDEGFDAYYLDVSYNYEYSENISVGLSTQYLSENEKSKSGIEADIYGVMAEVSLYDFGVNLAYNYGDRKDSKTSFAGFGGGTLFTSMDTMTLDGIIEDREVESIMASLSYSMKNFDFSYAYGDFQGKKNSDGDKAHIVEQNFGVEYNFNDKFSGGVMFVIEDDKENSEKTESDFNRLQVTAKYNF